MQTDLFLPLEAASRVPHVTYLPTCFTSAPWVSRIEPLIQWPEDERSRQSGSGWGLPPSLTLLSFQVSEMRRTLTPANSPVSSPSKHGDRFIPSRAGANWSVNFHRINVRADGGGEVPLTLPLGAGPGHSSSLPLLSLLLPQENEKSPSQNRKAKDATSDNGKGQESGPQILCFTPLPGPTPASQRVWCLQMAWPTQPC